MFRIMMTGGGQIGRVSVLKEKMRGKIQTFLRGLKLLEIGAGYLKMTVHSIKSNRTL
jgi:hypothetical protein